MRRDNQKAVDAILGVCLMVGITVAIAALVYFYATSLDPSDATDMQTVEYSGVLYGFNADEIFIGNDTIDNVRWIDNGDRRYLQEFLGEYITIGFEKEESYYNEGVYYYYYEYAYLNH